MIDRPSEWKVEIAIRPAASRAPCAFSRLATRSFISRAALLVNVIAAIARGIVPLRQQVRDLGRDHARLAAAGAGQHQQRTVDVADRLALRGVQGQRHRKGRFGRDRVVRCRPDSISPPAREPLLQRPPLPAPLAHQREYRVAQHEGSPVNANPAVRSAQAVT